jgi:hypothetical protein
MELNSDGHRSYCSLYQCKKKSKIVPVLNYLSTMPWRQCGSEDIPATFLTSALDAGEWSASLQHHFIPGTHWVDPRFGMDAVKRKILHCWESNPDRQARSPLLNQLSYPDSIGVKTLYDTKSRGTHLNIKFQHGRVPEAHTWFYYVRTCDV